MKKNKGFTLIELLVVIAIIGLLASIVLTMLGSGKDKGGDAKVQAQLRSMVPQAQLYTGPIAAVAATTTSPVGSGAAGRNLFTSNTAAENSLYKFTNTLPTGTVVYYASEAVSPLAGGKWAFAASTSVGSFCVDYTGVGKNQSTTVMTTGNASTIYTLLAGSYSCN